MAGGSKASLPPTTGPDERKLTPLEKAFYCDDVDRIHYDPGKPEDWSAFLLDARGKQRACLSDKDRARPARTPILDLDFRKYFVHPKEGSLWHSPPAARSRHRHRAGAPD